MRRAPFFRPFEKEAECPSLPLRRTHGVGRHRTAGYHDNYRTIDTVNAQPTSAGRVSARHQQLPRTV